MKFLIHPIQFCQEIQIATAPPNFGMRLGDPGTQQDAWDFTTQSWIDLGFSEICCFNPMENSDWTKNIFWGEVGIQSNNHEDKIDTMVIY